MMKVMWLFRSPYLRLGMALTIQIKRARARAARQLRHQEAQQPPRQEPTDKDHRVEELDNLLFANAEEPGYTVWASILPRGLLESFGSSPLYLPPDEFVRFFASINSVMPTVSDT